MAGIKRAADFRNALVGLSDGRHGEPPEPSIAFRDGRQRLSVEAAGKRHVRRPSGMGDDARRRRDQLEADATPLEAFEPPGHLEQQRIEGAVAGEAEAFGTGLYAEGTLPRELGEEIAREGMGVDVDDHWNGLRG